MFQVALPCYLGLNSGRSLSINVNKTRKHFPSIFPFMAPACFPNVSQFPIWEKLFPVSALLFSRGQLCLGYTAGNFNENPSMQALAKILRARASEHSCNFCEQFGQRPNFASTFKLDGTVRYPSLWWRISFSIKVQTTLVHIRFAFNTMQTSEKLVFLSVTHWREQRCLDSYRQWQISQSDCKISSNCCKKKSIPPHPPLPSW